MSAPDDRVAPRPLTERERAWCAWLLPHDRPAYAALASAVDESVVIGEGRWGEGDLVLGRADQEVDLEAPMEPVASYGEIAFEDGAVLSISIHQPDDEGRIEMHLSGPALEGYEHRVERSRWCYAYWSPGDPAPSGDAMPRLVALDDAGELTLAIDASRRVMWLHDSTTRGTTLVPVTSFYNELMLLKGVRDPRVALEHRRLFDDPAASTDAELRAAFVRYNMTWRKVEGDRLAPTPSAAIERPGLLARLRRALRGGNER